MDDSDPRDERVWETGWDGHAAAQMRRLSRLPMLEKLAWLEDAQRLLENLRRGREGTGPRGR